MKNRNQRLLLVPGKYVILFNAHYPISLRSKEKELIRMFEIVLGRGKWTCLKQNGKEQVKNIYNLMPHA